MKIKNKCLDKEKYKKGNYKRNIQKLERETGIEPASKAWEAAVLPLNYSRNRFFALKTQIYLSSYGMTTMIHCDRFYFKEF